MSASIGRAEHVVVAMQAGRDRELLAEWLDARPDYTVEQSGGEFEVDIRGDPGIHLTFLEVGSVEE